MKRILMVAGLVAVLSGSAQADVTGNIGDHVTSETNRVIAVLDALKDQVAALQAQAAEGGYPEGVKLAKCTVRRGIEHCSARRYFKVVK